MLKCSLWWGGIGKVFPYANARPAITVPPNRISGALKNFSISRALKLNPTQKQQQTVFLFACRRNCSVTAMEEEASTKHHNSSSLYGFLSKKPYDPPSWASHLNPIPSHIFSLGHVPTPIHKWNLPNLPNNTEVWLKRDDLSGMQLSGNKVRKLEFLLAEAVAQGADCIITIGGIQSNHARATAVAAKYLDLDCYLILRTSKVLVDKDPGLTGNLLVERLVGAHIDLVSKEEYAKTGSLALTNLLKEKLISERRKPYVIPVGGSNSLGTWGYIEAVREIEQQLQTGNGKAEFDDIVVACGSGGTTAGLAIGSWLSELKAKVHAFSVCDDPDYFYEYVQGLLDGLQAGVSSRNIVDIKNAKGLGYAMNTPEELKFVKEVAQTTGVVLDPVYSGKAARGMMKDMAENPMKWAGRKILFIHTGGLLGLFDKTAEMASLVGNWREMDVPESTLRKDGSGKMF
ncbi:bifunctional D-cysteine desulfhydrase/1-aminocyclopropane-1-carboxylate deaminase, mitochondrial isoform X2 [Rhododendron vialii]|uniref:bifunctional D-cysteine desulfhydrase/1-aminocyclopropane-1-carboxylate deaminase, mitochondrial isoform X2 n=1 Tax=Rhododendron vialii TaxID=182163 RepID=UPI00265DC521|nr:bifunctional D-cysteine desulfhydrase/1-aminocyclopropane-1-carboxylate deaminase, mitochondrial isoform X2 [Rhododendron vialii]